MEILPKYVKYWQTSVLEKTRIKQRTVPIMVADNLLQEVPVEDWIKLREVLRIDWPAHCFPFLAIENLERLHRKKKINPKIFCLDGDWSDGTFILKDGIDISMYTLQPSCERLHIALKLFDWNNLPEIRLHFVTHVDVFEKVSSVFNLQVGKCFPHTCDAGMNWNSEEKER